MKRAVLLSVFLCSSFALGQNGNSVAPDASAARAQEIKELRAELARLSSRLDALEHGQPSVSAAALQPTSASPAPASPTAPATPGPVQPANQMPATVAQPSVLPGALPGGVTLNYTFDGYYEYNFNQPPGRVNNLRGYDVLSNAFSINQAAVIFALDPDLDRGRRYGLRLDLQFGQATEALQGSSANEPRPSVYRNVYQAYGTYIFPVGKGLTVDFGKWSSSLGSEGNYSKDQANYTRSFFFNFLPYYHAGVRASYPVSPKLTLNYWLVNGANQTEPVNGFKDELFGFVLQPTKSITWTSNYYLGQEHADATSASSCTVPVQTGLCVTAIDPAPNGKLHIFDNYVKWQVTPKLTLVGEGDYVIQREWATAAPGHPAAPSHVSGGAVSAQYQLTPRTLLATRGEYLSDRGGLFSTSTQALKEGTATYKFNFAPGFDAFFEFRRDWSNKPYFVTSTPGSPSNSQTTSTVGLVWWYGGKQGAW